MNAFLFFRNHLCFVFLGLFLFPNFSFGNTAAVNVALPASLGGGRISISPESKGSVEVEYEKKGGEKLQPVIIPAPSPEELGKVSPKSLAAQKKARAQDERISLLLRRAHYRMTPKKELLFHATFREPVLKFHHHAIPFYSGIFALSTLQVMTDLYMNPGSFDSFIEHMKDPLGHFSFATFIMGSQLTQLAFNLTSYQPWVLKWLSPYLGMAAGSVISELTNEFMHDAGIKDCVKKLTTGSKSPNLTESCNVAFHKWTSNPHWIKLAPSAIGLILGAFLSGQTMGGVATSSKFIAKNIAKTAAARPISSVAAIFNPLKKIKWLTAFSLQALNAALFLKWVEIIDEQVRFQWYDKAQSRMDGSRISTIKNSLNMFLDPNGASSRKPSSVFGRLFYSDEKEETAVPKTEKQMVDSLNNYAEIMNSWRNLHIGQNTMINHSYWSSFMGTYTRDMELYAYFLDRYKSQIFRHDGEYTFKKEFNRVEGPFLPLITHNGSPVLYGFTQEERWNINKKEWHLDVGERNMIRVLESHTLKHFKETIVDAYKRELELGNNPDFFSRAPIELEGRLTLEIVGLTLHEGLDRVEDRYKDTLNAKDKKLFKELRQIAELLTSSKREKDDGNDSVYADFKYPTYKGEVSEVGEGIRRMNKFLKRGKYRQSLNTGTHSSHLEDLIRDELFKISEAWGDPKPAYGMEGFFYDIDYLTKTYADIPDKLTGYNSNVSVRNLGEYYLMALICGEDHLKGNEPFMIFEKGRNLKFKLFRIVDLTPDETEEICNEDIIPRSAHYGPGLRRNLLERKNILNTPLEFRGKKYLNYHEFVKAHMIKELQSGIESWNEYMRPINDKIMESSVKRFGSIYKERLKPLIKEDIINDETSGSPHLPHGLAAVTEKDLDTYFKILDAESKKASPDFRLKYLETKRKLLFSLSKYPTSVTEGKKDHRFHYENTLLSLYDLFRMFDQLKEKFPAMDHLDSVLNDVKTQRDNMRARELMKQSEKETDPRKQQEMIDNIRSGNIEGMLDHVKGANDTSQINLNYYPGPFHTPYYKNLTKLSLYRIYEALNALHTKVIILHFMNSKEDKEEEPMPMDYMDRGYIVPQMKSFFN